MPADFKFLKYGEAESPSGFCTFTDVEMFNRRHYEAAKVINYDSKVLDLACGQGIGIEYFSKKCAELVAADAKIDNLRDVVIKGRSTSDLVSADANSLPFKDNYYDAVLILEAVYYFPDISKCIEESARVLKPNKGTLFFCLPNKNIPAFRGSEYAHSYYSITEISELLSSVFYDVRAYGGFPVSVVSKKTHFRAIRKIIAVVLNNLPLGTVLKNYLKFKFMGYSHNLPYKVMDGQPCGDELEELPMTKNNEAYQVIYIVAKEKHI